MAWPRLIPTSVFVLIVRLSGAGAGFLAQLLLARLLAPEALGTFFSATSLAAVLGLVAAWGYPNLAPRFIARYRERGQPELIRAFLRSAAWATAISSVVAGLVVTGGALWWPGLAEEVRVPFLIAGLSIPVMSAIALNAGTAGAIRAFALSYVPESLLRPILFLGFIGVMLAFGQAMTVSVTVALYFVITVVLGLAQFLILRHLLPKVPPHPVPRLAKFWRAEAVPLVIVALFTGLFSDLDILFVTPLLQGADVAAFGIALKLALLVGFGVQVAHSVVAPDLADAHARRNLGGTGHTLWRASLLPVAFTGIATLASAAGGQYFLALFHPDFAAAKWALTILIFCQFLRAVAGPSVHLLTVIGAQRMNALLCLLALVVLAVSNAVLAPGFGVTGAAIAVGLSWSVWIAATGLALHHRAGLRSDLFHLALIGRREHLAAASG